MHEITSTRVNFTTDAENNTFALVRAYINQEAQFSISGLRILGINDPFGLGVPTWILNKGWYENTWKRRSDGTWCLYQFIAYTHHIFFEPYKVQLIQTNTKPGGMHQIAP